MPGLASRALRCVLVLETLASVTLEKRSSSDNFLGLAYALASLSLSLSLSLASLLQGACKRNL